MPVILSMYDLELSNPWIPDLQSLARHLGAETRIFRPTPGVCLAAVSLAAAAVAPQLQDQPSGQHMEQQAPPSSAVAAACRRAREGSDKPSGWVLLGTAARIASHRARRLQEQQPLPDALQLAALELLLRVAEAGMLRLGAAADAALAAGRRRRLQQHTWPRHLRPGLS